METQDKVRAIICNHLKVNSDDVTNNARFYDDLGADSLDLAELIMAIEEEFGAEILDEHYHKIKTVGDVINFIEKGQ